MGVDLGEFEPRLCVGEIRLGLHHVRFECGRLNLREDLAIGHFGIKVHKQFLDRAGNLAAHLDVDHRRQIAVGRHGLNDFAACEDRALEIQLHILRAFDVSDGANGDDRENHHDQQPFHPARSLFSWHIIGHFSTATSSSAGRSDVCRLGSHSLNLNHEVNSFFAPSGMRPSNWFCCVAGDARNDVSVTRMRCECRPWGGNY